MPGFWCGVRPVKRLGRPSAADREGAVHRRQAGRTGGALWLYVLRSPHAHAKIASIDTTAATEMPGVGSRVHRRRPWSRTISARSRPWRSFLSGRTARRWRFRRRRLAGPMRSCASPASRWRPFCRDLGARSPPGAPRKINRDRLRTCCPRWSIRLLATKAGRARWSGPRRP